MKVLHITNAYPYKEYCAYGIFVKEQIDALSDIGINVKTYFINSRKNGLRSYYSCINEIRSLANSFRPDVIHCHHEFTFFPTILANLHLPIALSVMGDISRRSIFNQVLFKLSSIRADAIIIKSRPVKKRKYYFVPNGVDLDFFYPSSKEAARSQLGLNLSKKYVLFVSADQKNPIKRYDKFSSVISLLNEILPGQVEQLLLTNVERDIVPVFYNAADFLLFTSDHEGSPNAVKEAMACNLPIVSSNVGNVESLFAGGTGLFISRDATLEQFVKLSLEALKCDMSNGRDLILRNRFDKGSVAEEICMIYSSLM